MRETKLIQLLSRLSSVEIKSLDKFISSSYFNTSSTINLFWKNLKKYAPDFTAPQLTEEKIYKKVFPNKPFQKKKLYNIRYELLQLVEKFLAVESFQSNDLSHKKYVADAYFDKELYKEFEKQYHQLIGKLKEEKNSSIEHLHLQRLLHHKLYFNNYRIKKEKYPDDLLACTQLLDNFYYQERLFYASEWFSTSKRYNYTIPESIIAFGASIDKKQDWAILAATPQNMALKITSLLLVKGVEAEAIYYSLKKDLANSCTIITLAEKNRVLKLLINYCIAKSKEQEGWDREMLDLYKIGLADQSILDKGKMTAISFINIAYQASFFKDFDWTEQFIISHKNRMPEENKASFIKLAEGYMAFFKDNFEQCLFLLSQVTINNLVLVEIVRKGLIIRSAFECYIVDNTFKKPLLIHLNTYNRYLNRKKVLSSAKKTAYLNFNNLLLRLVNWMECKQCLLKLEAIKQSLLNLDLFPIAGKEWLLKHITNFEGYEA